MIGELVMMKIPETNIVLETMPKRALNYYKHLKIVYFWTNFVKYGFLLLFILATVSTVFMRKQLAPEIFNKSLVLCGVLFFIVMVWHLFQKIFLGSFYKRRVNVFEDRVEIFEENEGEHKEVLNFKDVESVGWGFYSFFGVFVVRTKDQVFRFSAFLHRAEYILESIEEFKPAIFEGQDFEELRNSVLSADHRLSRVHDMFFGKYKWFSLFTYFLLPIIGIAMIFWQQFNRMHVYSTAEYGVSLTNLVISLAFFVGMVHFLITEFLFDKELQNRLHEEFEDKGRDLDYEDHIYAKSNPAKILGMAFAFYSIITFDFNLYGYYRIENSSADLNVLKNDVYLVDKRFNCMDCQYSLHKNNEIVFVHNNTVYYGKIVADQLRKPASAEETPEVEVKVNDQGEVFKVPFYNIQGKVIRD